MRVDRAHIGYFPLSCSVDGLFAVEHLWMLAPSQQLLYYAPEWLGSFSSGCSHQEHVEWKKAGHPDFGLELHHLSPSMDIASPRVPFEPERSAREGNITIHRLGENAHDKGTCSQSKPKVNSWYATRLFRC